MEGKAGMYKKVGVVQGQPVGYIGKAGERKVLLGSGKFTVIVQMTRSSLGLNTANRVLRRGE